MLIDVLILAGPIRVVQNLQMPMAKKVSVISIFLLGFVVSAQSSRNPLSSLGQPCLTDLLL
jgi:hypothetical protein